MHLVPVQSVVEIRSRIGRKPNAQHSSGPPQEVGLDLFPGNRRFRVGIKSRHSTTKLSILPGRQADVLGFEAIPKPSNEFEPFCGRQSRDIEHLDHGGNIARSSLPGH
jgi:hypothetical protein